VNSKNECEKKKIMQSVAKFGKKPTFVLSNFSEVDFLTQKIMIKRAAV